MYKAKFLIFTISIIFSIFLFFLDLSCVLLYTVDIYSYISLHGLKNFIFSPLIALPMLSAFLIIRFGVVLILSRVLSLHYKIPKFFLIVVGTPVLISELILRDLVVGMDITYEWNSIERITKSTVLNSSFSEIVQPFKDNMLITILVGSLIFEFSRIIIILLFTRFEKYNQDRLSSDGVSLEEHLQEELDDHITVTPDTSLDRMRFGIEVKGY